jgi:hypothetical protein
VYLYTPLRGGGMVFTRDYAGGAQVDDESLSVRNVPTEDLERLAGAHHDRVEDMRRRGKELEVRATQAGRQQATHSFYASHYYRKTSTRFLLPALLSFCAAVGLFLWAILAPLLTSRHSTRHETTQLTGQPSVRCRTRQSAHSAHVNSVRRRRTRSTCLA